MKPNLKDNFFLSYYYAHENVGFLWKSSVEKKKGG